MLAATWPLPPIEEQQAIINWLASVETQHPAVRRKLADGIELLREYRTRLVADVVTGKLDVREAAAKLPDEAPPETIEHDDLSAEPEAEEEAAVA